ELDRDGSAQRMADDVARASGRELSEIVPGRLRILICQGFGRRRGGAAPEAAIVHGQHRESKLSPTVDAAGTSGEVPAGAMEIEDDGRVRVRIGQVPRVQLLVARDRDPVILERV